VRVGLSPAARRDRREAEAWYCSHSRRAAERFREELQLALLYISEYPQGSRILKGDTRGKTLLHFPYTVVYTILPDRVRVLAIADERRDPDHYASRFA
jgi:plasmid stabilization system protein ParE